jgi:RNA polymerase sigma-70 factor, ECF subfamily
LPHGAPICHIETGLFSIFRVRFSTNHAIAVMGERTPSFFPEAPEPDRPESEPMWADARGSSAAEDFGERIRFVRSGHTEALGEVLDTCRTYLLLVANRGLPEDVKAKVGASDLVQEAFLQAQQIFDRFQGESQEELRAWLTAILENKLAQVRRQYLGTAMRDIGREVPFAGGSSSPGIAGAVDPGAEPASEIFAAAEEAQRFEAAMKRLPADYQTAIEIRNLERKSFAELGAVLNRSADAARHLWLRAIERLKKELGLSDDSDDPLIESDEPQGARS